MRSAAAIAQAGRYHLASLPDPPPCIVTGAAAQEAEHEIRDPLRFPVAAVIENGEPVPGPTRLADTDA